MTTAKIESATPEAEPLWLTIARGELGVREIPGTEANRRILGYFGSTRLAPEADEVPWCAAFVGWCLRKAGLQGTGKANARSYLDWGVELTEPRLGCVVVLKRGDNPAQGHVGFLVGWDHAAGELELLGGNQGNRVCVKTFGPGQMLGWRWPEGST